MEGNMDSNLLNFMDRLKKELGGNLKSFVVYGSAATGELYRKSDYNTLIVTDEIELKDLDKISRPIKDWVKKGNPVPMIFTDHSLLRSEDVFPMEFLDIKENNITLFGENYFRKMKVPEENLRIETERELKSALLKLMRAYVMTAGKPGDMKRVMRESISGVVSIFRGVLRLYKIRVPQKKLDVVGAMPLSMKLNKRIFSDILSLKQGKDAVKDARAVFYEYIEELERVIDAVDKKPKKRR
jgi:predicted nucleotidyltransferase